MTTKATKGAGLRKGC